MKINKILAGAFVALSLLSCNRELETESAKLISEEQIPDDAASLDKYLNGIYLGFRNHGSGGTTTHTDFGIMSIKAGVDLLSNDLIQAKQQHLGRYYNYEARQSDNFTNEIVWNTFYSKIFDINRLIEKIEAIGVNNENRHIYGQLLALRAYSYFNLVRFYALTYVGHQNELGVPLVTTASSPETPRARATVREVYNQITSDIENAITSLNGFTQRNIAQIDQRAAKAIAADIYLEIGDYTKAAAYANDARTGKTLMSQADYTGAGFSLKTNPEIIWGFDNSLQTKNIGNHYASFFSMYDSMNEGYAGAAGIYKIIDKRLYDKIPSTDYRKQVFNGATESTYTFNGKTKKHPPYVSRKFKDLTFFEGDYIYIRASSLYYIEAEALARLGQTAQARQVLYDITSVRDTGYTLSTNSGQSLIDEIILQKRIELWGEGYAWFDMKRLGVDLVRDYPGSNHTFGKFNISYSTDYNQYRFQIPQSEVSNNPNIVQNPVK